MFTLPPPDTCWIDRALSREGVFPLSAGFVLVLLGGEHYAVSGRYCGIPDNEEAIAMAVDLHCERGMVELDTEDQARAEAGEPIPWLAAQAEILCRVEEWGPFERGQHYVQTFALADDPPDYAGLTPALALQALADQDDAYELGSHTYTELDAAEFLRGVRAALGAL